MTESLEVKRTTWTWNAKKRAAAFALCEGKTWATIKAELEISSSTLASWKKAPEFQAVLDEYEEAAVDEARRMLRRSATRAAQKIIDVMESGYPQHTTRLAAAKDVLDRVGLKAPEKIEHEHSGTVEHHAIALHLEGRLLDLARRAGSQPILSEPDE